MIDYCAHVGSVPCHLVVNIGRTLYQAERLPYVLYALFRPVMMFNITHSYAWRIAGY